VVIDEFQRAPDLLSAIKAELNRDRRPGRLVLAGSARHEAVPELADYLTGRIELLLLWPFAMSELEPGRPSIIDQLFDGHTPERRPRNHSRATHVETVLRGGYPIAVRLPPDARDRWFSKPLYARSCPSLGRRADRSDHRHAVPIPAIGRSGDRADPQRRRDRPEIGIGRDQARFEPTEACTSHAFEMSDLGFKGVRRLDSAWSGLPDAHV